ncbi:hypothetical protein [Roseomonas sp. 18066]|uniref:hypothetical protein n=1 Tax=Roseomonas sp. 18066 TaxID=2681412 RepID=UPI00135A9F43|nr:hypothetical protein [Roseomonas sp. 18066]
MSGSVAAAVSALAAQIGALLTPPQDPAFTPEVHVTPTRLRAAGLGGFVGIDAAPRAERFARQIEAQVVVRIFAANPAALLAVEQRAATDIIGADPISLRSQGFLRVERTASIEPPLAAADGIVPAAGRDLRFAVLYEHRPAPDTGDGVIEDVAQGLVPAPLGPSARRVYSNAFARDPMADFAVVDAAVGGPAGAWSWHAASREIRQSSGRGAGAATPDGSQQGTYLLLSDAAAGGPLADFAAQAEIRSDGDGAIGLVYRFGGAGSFGSILLDRPGSWRLLARRSGGTGQAFAEGGVTTTAGYTPATWMRIGLLVVGRAVTLRIDDRIVLSGRDDGLPSAGGVGFFCCRNAQARFGRLSVTRL